MATTNNSNLLTLYINARLIDPATGRDEMGGILCDGKVISDIGPHLNDGKPRANSQIINCKAVSYTHLTLPTIYSV